MLFPVALLALSTPAFASLLDGLLGPQGALAPVTSALATQPLVAALIHPRPGALISADILAGILAPADVRHLHRRTRLLVLTRCDCASQCSATGVVAIQANITIGSLLDLCICLDIIGVRAPPVAT